MKKINFSHNWNCKLGQKEFTTIRKKIYYNEGDAVEVFLKGSRIVGTFQVQRIVKKRLCDISDVLLENDTGYKSAEAVALFKKFGIEEMDECYIIYIKNLEK